MNLSDDLRQELEDLLERLCAGGIDQPRLDRLQAIVLGSTEARELYLEAIQIHHSLEWLFRDPERTAPISSSPRPLVAPSPVLSEACRELVESAEGNSPRPNVPTSAPPVTKSPRRQLTRSSVAWSILAASLMFAVYFVGISWDMLGKKLATSSDSSPHPTVPSSHRPKSVATITDTADVEWSNSEISNLKSQINRGEALSITAGLVELQLKQGVKLLIEGPADWTIDGNNNATLKRGKLVAKVPTQAIGFTLQTPTAKIVDLGTEFGVEVGEYGSAEVHVLRGRVRATGLAAAGQNRAVAKSVVLEAGSTIRSDRGQLSEVETAVDDETFKSLAARMAKSDRQQVFMGSIPLGNLFDDRMPMTLAAAIETDTFQACPDSDHLGVQSVLIGGDAIKSLTREIRLDLTNLGWTGQSYSLPCNDAAVPNRELQERWAIHTKGFKPRPAPGKAEDGIGMHTDCVLTFDLDEIRAAGGLAGRPLRFVCDRAGINDERIGIGETRCRLLVVVCNANAVTSAYVNGAQIDAQRENEVWQIAKQTDDSLIKAGSFSTFNISLPGEARYLTLAATSGEGGTCTHTVWSGARLEVQ